MSDIAAHAKVLLMTQLAELTPTCLQQQSKGHSQCGIADPGRTVFAVSECSCDELSRIQRRLIFANMRQTSLAVDWAIVGL